MLVGLIEVGFFDRLRPAGEAPSPRAAHAAAAVGTMVVFQVRYLQILYFRKFFFMVGWMGFTAFTLKHESD